MIHRQKYDGLFRVLSLSLLCSCAFSLSTSFAYPVMMKVKDLRHLQGISRNSIVAFSVQPDKKWQRIPIQIDEMESESFLVLRHPSIIRKETNEVAYPPTQDPFSGYLSSFHRAVLDDTTFGNCNNQCDEMSLKIWQDLCRTYGGLQGVITKITLDYLKSTAFIAACSSEIPVLSRENLSFDLEKGIIDNKYYQVALSDSSPFLIKSLSLKQAKVPILKDGQLKALLKTKFFVSLNIGKKDLAAFKTAVYQGPLGTSLELAMKDSFLGFGGNKQVCCDITFYKDAFYFPVFIETPSSIGKLREGSNVSLGFKFNGDRDLDFSEISDENATGLLFRGEGGSLAVALRGTSKKVYKAEVLQNEKDFSRFKLSDANIGLSVDLQGSEGEQRLETWYYLGDNEALLREYSLNGIKYSWNTIP